MKLNRHEKRLLNNLACYACLGSDYPVEEERKILKLFGIIFLVGFPLCFTHLLAPIFYFFAIFIMLFLAAKKNYIHDKEVIINILRHQNRYIHEYTLLKQEDSDLTVEIFVKAVKKNIVSQEEKETEKRCYEEKRETEDIRRKYGI